VLFGGEPPSAVIAAELEKGDMEKGETIYVEKA
jgi:hypothetical protein